MIELELASGATVELYVAGSLAYPRRMLSPAEIDEVRAMLEEQGIPVVLQAHYAAS